MKKLLFLTLLAALFASCSNKHTYTVVEKMNVEKLGPRYVIRSKPVNTVPYATAFRMSGDYSDNVAVTLAPDGELQYFPAPSDITAYSKPVDLGNGWWLNNQGIGPNSVFTKYTLAEYAALAQTPSPQQIKLNIIPGAKVTQFIQLPYKTGEASNHIEEIKLYLQSK